MQNSYPEKNGPKVLEHHEAGIFIDCFNPIVRKGINVMKILQNTDNINERDGDVFVFIKKGVCNLTPDIDRIERDSELRTLEDLYPILSRHWGNLSEVSQ